MAVEEAGAFPNMLGTTITVDTDQTGDFVTGSPLRDFIAAGAGDTVNAAGGNDTIDGGGYAHVEGGEGDDAILNADESDGGPGDDRFVDALSPNGIDGGIGEDTLELDFNGKYPAVDLDFTLTAAVLQLASGGEFIDFPVVGFEHAMVELPNGGAQIFNASAFPGDLIVRGFGGPDTITGTKKTDYISGGKGSDVIETRDGVFDTVDCGDGSDVARADGIDKLIGCESVTYAKPATSAIKGPGKIRRGGSGTFKFSSSVPGSVFQCRIDSRKWKTCASPHQVSGSSLSKGSHTLRVRAGYPKGNWDSTPSKKAFKVVS